MKKALFITASLVLAITASSFAQTKIESKDAGKHLNETVMVCDKIVGGKFFSNSQTTLLDVTSAHPNETMTVVIKGDDRKKFSEAPETYFLNKKVCITGKLIDYKGKPEIIITEASQLVIDKN
ncbi:hypothetical protein [Mucilaginibacter ginkgonis]|uniref:Micrococcal nuclease n=1 Tax=Mucilaginibacter ginkgonis TaxID=2682091 RepID=A0A6I4HUP1_9SPHI|nr:hypothetical protein [Mucilaginibacter ginkgonis]QQL50364.1 hypothetical protein GO620_002595 [Mucilaginibacter ginkgonis]